MLANRLARDSAFVEQHAIDWSFLRCRNDRHPIWQRVYAENANGLLHRSHPASFVEAIQKAEVALQAEGFGIISRIDLQDAFKTKLGTDFRPYTILGACNPKLAHQALQIEDKVGTMLPCNVVVQEVDAQHTEVAAIDPVASMQAIENADLIGAAGEVRDKLARVIELLKAGAAASG